MQVQRAYCTSCKQRKYVLNKSYLKVKTPSGNPRNIIKGKCVDCGAGIYQFIKNGGTFKSFIKGLFDW
tara:strand:- start:638 stop:841 length:204 start_codon:yes stop_codon:yes gene_type:complete